VCRKDLFALSGFDSPSWLSKTGRNVHVALFHLLQKGLPATHQHKGENPSH
jgi:hypothetical protein